MFTVPSMGCSTPASAAEVRARVFISPTSPAYSITTLVIGPSVNCPAKLPSFSASSHEGLQTRRFIGGNGRHVERIGDRPGDQVIRHLLGHLQGHILLRFSRRGSEMRCHNNIFMAKQFVRGRRFGFKNIQRRPRHFAGNNRLIERIFDNQAAARAIDDANPFLALGKGSRIHDMARLCR